MKALQVFRIVTNALFVCCLNELDSSRTRYGTACDDSYGYLNGPPACMGAGF